MRTRRKIVFGVLVVAIALLATGTGGFSSIEAERGVDVAVAEDEHALLGIEVAETEGTVGNSFTLLKLFNNFDQDISVESVEADDKAPIDVQSATVNGAVTVECLSAVTSAEVDLTVSVTGDDVSITKYKDVEVTCNEATPTPSPTPTSTPTQTPNSTPDSNQALTSDGDSQ